jgi:hypothetical protein
MSRILFGLLVVFASAARAEDAHYLVPLDELSIIEGHLPKGSPEAWRIRSWQPLQPYAVLDGTGEAYVGIGQDFTPWNTSGNAAGVAPAGNPWNWRSLVVRAPQGKDVTGRLFYPNQNWTGMVRLTFRIPAARASADARPAFDEGRRWHYEQLLRRNVPGGAWFRYQAGKSEPDNRPGRPGRPPRTPADLAETYALFTGGRAMSENIQLDRALIQGQPDGQPVNLSTLQGITVRDFDWKPLVKQLKPQRDPLARLIPADQHAVFIPSFDAASRLAEEFRNQGSVVLELAQPRSEDTGILARYEYQLGLSLDAASRLFGPLLIQSLAVTGSDPFFPMGTDLAVLFQTNDPDRLATMLLGKMALNVAQKPAAKFVSGTAVGIPYRGFISPDRSVSTYVATSGGVVLVTNSLRQIEAIAAVAAGKVPALDTLPEYTYFRDRYRRGDQEESAFLILSDLTIRRWCGPRWRIADSRRVREAARLWDARVRRLDTGEAEPPTGALGTLAFLTPIAEMDITQVTKAEADAYNRWRQGYEQNWSWVFDPIGMRVGLRPGHLSADMTVLPLIAGTQYRETLELSQGTTIPAGAGDPHGALGHFVLALNPQSRPVRQANDFLARFLKDLKVEPLGWLGGALSVYVDDSPFWQDVAKLPSNPTQREQFLRRNVSRLPVAVRVEVASGLKLTAFLVGLRGFIEQTAPGMTRWEALRHKGEGYVKVSSTEQSRGFLEEFGERLALYYYATGEALVLTLNEDVLKQAIDRRQARKAAKTQKKTEPWLGGSAALRVQASLLDRFLPVLEGEYQWLMQDQCWGNLPILNEWHRRFPGQDPVAFHQKHWGTKLLCPGGGKYVWNEAWQTYESSVYGHPGEPKSGPKVPPALSLFRQGEFGLTFENQGVRARAVLTRRAGK